MQRAKRWSRATAALLALLLVLTACGSRGTDVLPNDEDDIDESEIVCFSDVPLFSDEETPVSPDSKAMGMVEKMLPQYFFSYYVYTAETNTDTYKKACEDRIRGRMGDDIYFLRSDAIRSIGAAGMLADVSETAGADQLTDIARAACTVNGVLVAFPRAYTAYGLAVNQTLLDRYGLALPETAEELLNCCEVLQQKGIDHPLAGDAKSLAALALANGLGSFYQSQEQLEKLYQGQETLGGAMGPGLQLLQRCMKRAYLDTERVQSAPEMFLDGEAAFLLCNTAALAMPDSALSQSELSVQMIGLPAEAGRIAVTDTTGVAISANNRKMPQSREALTAICSPNVMKLYCDGSGSFPSRRDVESAAWQMASLAEITTDLETGRTMPTVDMSLSPEWWDSVCQAVQQLLSGSTVDDCLEKLAG